MAEHNFHPKYRSDIDELRALAILPVIVYHAFPHYAPGGFIGVDIFFVISGYLISSILFKSFVNNHFALSEFYTHRVKRLFPALLLVTSTCYVFGWIALLPDEFKQLGKHIAAGLGFAQNIVLWQEAGYFDVASESKPLMHLWSLAVEEQFYLIYPLLLWFAWKARLNLLTSIMLLCVTSFVLSRKGVHNDSVKAFFAPHTRFWELMFGSVLAYIHSFSAWKPALTRWIHAGIFNHIFFREIPLHEDRSALLSSLLSVLGLLLIAYSIITYKSNMIYPGSKALLPVIGATLLISAGADAWVNRHILSNKALVWIGLISYPLYLWHWPLLSFARIVEAGTPARSILMAAIGISFLLAALTYYFIEKPIRYCQRTGYKVTTLCTLALIVGFVGYNTFARNGLPFRMKEVMAKNAMFSDENNPGLASNQDERCKLKFNLMRDDVTCRLAKDGEPSVQVIGDSHANSFYPGLREVLQASSDNVLQLGAGGCVPFLGVASFDTKFDAVGKNRCLIITKQAIEIATNNPHIHTVIMWSRGPLYLTGKGFDYAHVRDEQDHDRVLKLIANPSELDPYAIWNKAMRETLDLLVSKHKQVIYVLDNPELGFDPKSCIDFRPVRLNRTQHVQQPCKVPRKDFEKRNQPYRNLVMSVLKDYPSVQIFDAAALLCDQNWCWAIKDDKVLYRDDDHLSLDGAHLMAKELVKLFQKN